MRTKRTKAGFGPVAGAFVARIPVFTQPLCCVCWCVRAYTPTMARALRKLSPDSALFRRRAREESLRDLAPDHGRGAQELGALLRDRGGRPAPAPGQAGAGSRAN
jgi:hypothetical protein